MSHKYLSLRQDWMHQRQTKFSDERQHQQDSHNSLRIVGIPVKKCNPGDSSELSQVYHIAIITLVYFDRPKLKGK